ncbi:hypothetical protein FB99_45210 (plasmid) [Pantoea agglomerans]|nr:hypothetical protein FB99_45210 [Pantoea agglomerans]
MISFDGGDCMTFCCRDPHRDAAFSIKLLDGICECRTVYEAVG